MVDLAASVSLYGNTALPLAMDLPVSSARAFFDSKPFGDWRTSRESESKTRAAVVNRLNEVIRGLSVVAKVVAGRR